MQKLAGLIHGATEIVMAPARGVLALAELYYVLLRMLWVHKKVLSAARKTWSGCDRTCTGCAMAIYDWAGKTREKLSILQGKLKAAQGPSFFIRAIGNSLVDWDDLVEDCLISADDDIRESIHRIASLS